MPTNGRPCTVCNLADRVRESIEAEHLAGTSVRAIAAQFAGTASESAIRRHLVGGHAKRNVFRPSDLDDDFTLAEAVGGASRGLKQLMTVRDEAYANRNHLTFTRTAAETTRATESLVKLGIPLEDKVTTDLRDHHLFLRAMVATAKRHPALTAQYATAMAEGGDKQEKEVSASLERLLESIRITNKEN